MVSKPKARLQVSLRLILTWHCAGTVRDHRPSPDWCRGTTVGVVERLTPGSPSEAPAPGGNIGSGSETDNNRR